MVYRFRVGTCPLSTWWKQALGEAALSVANGTIANQDPKTGICYDIDKDTNQLVISSPKFRGIKGAEVGHACLLLNTDVFEFDQKGWHRRKDVGRDYITEEKHKFDWDILGSKVNGTTKVSPDQLEEIIKSESKWEIGTYNVLKHNCHQFVMYCLDKIGAGYFFNGYNMPLMKLFS